MPAHQGNQSLNPLEYTAHPDLYWNVKYIPEHVRASLPEDDFAGPNRSFPIRNEYDVEAAAYLVGHAQDPSAVKKKIIDIAKRKGIGLPGSWRNETNENMHKSLKDDDGSVLVSLGGEVKSIGKNKIGGYVVIYTKADDPDLTNDFFAADTDYDMEDGDRRSGYYKHGFDPILGNSKIGSGVLTKDDTGIWLEAQLNERDEYVEMIMGMVEDGQLGYSTGSVSHLVRRQAVTKAVSKLTNWPIGEWSLVPNPAEPRTIAVSMKSWRKSAELTTPKFTIDPTERELEVFLREAGLSRKASTALASHYKSIRNLREAGEVSQLKEEPVDEAAESRKRVLLAKLSSLALYHPLIP